MFGSSFVDPDPDPYWIRIQELSGSRSVFGIRIRIHTCNHTFNIDSITLDPDPNWAKILDPDPNWAKILDPDLNLMYLDPQHCLVVRNGALTADMTLRLSSEWMRVVGPPREAGDPWQSRQAQCRN